MSIYVEFQKDVGFKGLEKAMRRASEDLGWEFGSKDVYDQRIDPRSDTPQQCYRVTLAGVKTPWGSIRAILYRKAKARGLRLYECADVAPSQQDDWERAAFTYAHALRTYVGPKRAAQ